MLANQFHWLRKEQHERERLAHEEVYVVIEGRATFTVDGEEVDAPAGTVIFVKDPAIVRHAVARSAGTMVLAIGGPVGKAFEPSAWEQRGIEAAA